LDPQDARHPAGVSISFRLTFHVPIYVSNVCFLAALQCPLVALRGLASLPNWATGLGGNLTSTPGRKRTVALADDQIATARSSRKAKVRKRSRSQRERTPSRPPTDHRDSHWSDRCVLQPPPESNCKHVHLRSNWLANARQPLEQRPEERQVQSGTALLPGTNEPPYLIVHAASIRCPLLSGCVVEDVPAAGGLFLGGTNPRRDTIIGSISPSRYG